MGKIEVGAIKTGKNPRGFFRQDGLDRLAESMKHHGLLQPLVVRPLNDGNFELVAGERRLRAARSLGWTEIEVVEHVLDDQQAYEAASVENLVREDMSPPEEARAVKGILQMVDGDVAEAAKRIGRSERFVRSRLALLGCSENVQEALTKQEIGLGVAELLAGLPVPVQEATLPKILSEGHTVNELRGRILKALAQKLSEAKFDASDCADCQHNSTKVAQGDLFGEHIGAGYCQNPECYREKTLLWATDVKKPELKKEYSSVFIEGVEKTLNAGRQVVQNEVGAEAFDSCQMCGSYGAIVRTAPGFEGVVVEGLCFKHECLDAAKKAHGKDLATVQKTTAAPASGTSSQTSKSEPGKKAKAPQDTPKAVERAVDACMRKIGLQAINEYPEARRALVLMSVLKDCSSFLLEKFRGTCGSRPELLKQLFAMSHEEQTKLLTEVSDWIVSEMKVGFEDPHNESVKVCETLVSLTQTRLEGRFEFTEEFLKAQRKAGMIQILKESGFEAFYNALEGHDEKAFGKLVKGKVDDIVKAVMESDFSVGDYVPDVVSKRIPSPTQAAGKAA